MWIRSALLREQMTNHLIGEITQAGALNGLITSNRTIKVYCDPKDTARYPFLTLSKISRSDAVIAKLKGYTVYESLKAAELTMNYPITRIVRL